MNFFLDSGAFSALTQGGTIDLEAYMDFIQTNSEYINVYANLDVIGNVEASWQNQEIMEKAGLTPLPVFHVEDPFEYLDKCMEYEYFCLGGMASATQDLRLSFLDKCWYTICNTPDNMPKNKVHGFGMTSHRLMYRYPWYSVDSTSWSQTAGFGNVFIPRPSDKEEFDFTLMPFKISVSDESPSKAEYDVHLATATNAVRTHILKYLDKIGITEIGLKTSHWNRRYVNVEFFLGVERTMKWPRPFKPKLVNKGFGF